MRALRAAALCALGAALLGGPASAWDWGLGPKAVVVFETPETGKPSIDERLAAQAVQVLERRLESFGLSGRVERTGGRRIAVTLSAKSDDPEAVLKPLLRPARLEFRLADLGKKRPGPGETTLPEYELDPETQQLKKTPRVVEKAVRLTGADVVSAEADFAQSEPAVSVVLGPEGAAKLAKLSRENVDRALAVSVDGRIMSIAVIRAPIEGGRVMLAGAFTADEARDTARLLASGQLPSGLRAVSKTVDGKTTELAALPEPGGAPAETRPARPQAGASLRPGAPAAPAEPVSDVDQPPPPVRGPVDGVAVVIGVERTRQGLPPAEFAARDARVFADYLTHTLGYPEQNVALLLDACFSGAGRRSALAAGARPLVTQARPVALPADLAVLSAAAANQIGGSFDAQGHGLFTYYLLRSLRQAAGAGRVPTLAELYAGVAAKVEAQARRLTGNEQTPQLQATEAARAGSL